MFLISVKSFADGQGCQKGDLNSGYQAQDYNFRGFSGELFFVCGSEILFPTGQDSQGGELKVLIAEYRMKEGCGKVQGG